MNDEFARGETGIHVHFELNLAPFGTIVKVDENTINQ
jgi:hypothetical protein